MWLRQKKPPKDFTPGVVASCGGVKALDSGFQLFPHKGGTRKVSLPCGHINLFQECRWHTDIESNSVCIGFLGFGHLGFAFCALGLGFFVFFHRFFPFNSVVNKWTPSHTTATNIFQHFFGVAIGSTMWSTLVNLKGET